MNGYHSKSHVQGRGCIWKITFDAIITKIETETKDTFTDHADDLVILIKENTSTEIERTARNCLEVTQA